MCVRPIEGAPGFPHVLLCRLRRHAGYICYNPSRSGSRFLTTFTKIEKLQISKTLQHFNNLAKQQLNN